MRASGGSGSLFFYWKKARGSCAVYPVGRSSECAPHPSNMGVRAYFPNRKRPYLFCASAQLCSTLSTMDKERVGHPGIVLCYAADQALHDAVGEPGSPVARGPTPAVSAARLREFIFRTILATPLSQDDNCVVEKASKAGISYFHTVFHRMSQDQYHRVVQQLTRVFITNQTQTADWSCRVARDPAPALVTLLGVIGGAGTYMNPQSFGAGVFKY